MKKAYRQPTWTWQDEICNFLMALRDLGFWFTLKYTLGLYRENNNNE